MKKAIIVLFALALVVGAGTYAFYSFSRQARQSGKQDSQISAQETLLRAPSGPERNDSASTPLPPPALGKTIEPTVEPPRTLVGSTHERLKQIEDLLATDSRIYLSPIEGNKSVPALLEADVDGDGDSEVIAVHSAKPTMQEPTPPLFLSVLNQRQGKLVVKTSTPLTGGVLFNIQISGSAVPLAVTDLTGDSHPEIVVASGIGASLGGELQVFRLQDNSLVSLTRIGGNIFLLKSRAGGKGIITAQSRYQNKAVSYRWDGKEFVPIN